jgi:Tfp pilus assembly protein FimT
MLESQRAANGARVVALKLQQTRLKAMREDRPCGVEFMRYENEDKVSLQMRTVKDAPNFIELGAGGYEARCVVVPNTDGSKTAEIILVKKSQADKDWIIVDLSDQDDPIVKTWQRKVLKGQAIQFNRQGNWFYLNGPFEIADCDLKLPVNQELVGGKYPDAVHFKVTQRPTSMLNSITVLPRGTVVDFQHSGHESQMQSGGTEVTFGDYDASKATHVNRSVMVMFSPAGHVDRFYVDGTESSGQNRPFRGVLYLLVGEWDKITAGEDGNNNLQTGSNFWVTVKDRDGTVRTSPNNVADSNPRKHAREDLNNNIGGL